ncbi:DNA-binding protein [Candidatus Woesearchaeota archaeon]|nr:DNA-binding protein [Candidatus Woesearchaeota archaeon]
MQYRQAKLGRLFFVRLDHKEDIMKALRMLAVKEKIKTAVVHLLGGSDKASIIAGPKFSEVPPTPNFKALKEAREILGFGTIIQKNDKPVVHLHAAFGRDEQAIVGCVRDNSKVYVGVEAVVMEIAGIKAARTYNKELGTHIVSF